MQHRVEPGLPVRPEAGEAPVERASRLDVTRQIVAPEERADRRRRTSCGKDHARPNLDEPDCRSLRIDGNGCAIGVDVDRSHEQPAA